MEKRHILICGERGAGKSTLIERLLKVCIRDRCTAITRKTPRDERLSLHIHSPRRSGEAAQIRGQPHRRL